MNSGLGKSIGYWIKNNPMQILWLFLLIAVSIFKGVLIMEIIAIVIISLRTVEIFNVMTFSLPFSRKEIWNLHVMVESVLFAIYLCIKILQNTDNAWMLMIQIFFVLFAYRNCLCLPRITKRWWIGIVPMFVMAAITILMDVSPQIQLLIAEIAVNKYAFLFAVAIDLLMIILNIHTWIKEYRLFVKGDIYD